jgi:hypothetical protein
VQSYLKAKGDFCLQNGRCPYTDEWEKTFADNINALKKIVFSKSLKKAEWKDSTILKKIVPEEIYKLKKASLFTSVPASFRS